MLGTTEIKVRGYHLDMFSHVNNARYLEFLEEARWAAFEHTEFAPSEFLKRGWTIGVVNININYRFPAVMGDIILITTELDSFGQKSAQLKQIVTEKTTGKFIVDATVTFVIIDAKKGKAIEFPEDLKNAWFQLDK